jgi:hypothetical protein
LGKIGQEAFCNCSELREFSFKNTNKLQTISSMAFAHCDNLKVVELPPSLITIGRYAFALTRLRHLRIPKGVQTVERSAFFGARGLRDIQIDTSNPGVDHTIFFINNPSNNDGAPPEGCIVRLADGTAHRFTSAADWGQIDPSMAYSNNQVVVLLKNGDVKPLGEARSVPLLSLEREELTNMLNGQNITQNDVVEVFIPATVVKWGDSCFRNWGSLQTVHIPPDSDLEKIGVYSFCYCRKLKIFPFKNTKELQSIATMAFMRCDSLKDVELPSSIRDIGNYVFALTGLEHIRIPKNVQTVGQGVFWMTGGLRDIQIDTTSRNVNYTKFFTNTSPNDEKTPPEGCIVRLTDGTAYCFASATGWGQFDPTLLDGEAQATASAAPK